MRGHMGLSQGPAFGPRGQTRVSPYSPRVCAVCANAGTYGSVPRPRLWAAWTDPCVPVFAPSAQIPSSPVGISPIPLPAPATIFPMFPVREHDPAGYHENLALVRARILAYVRRRLVP